MEATSVHLSWFHLILKLLAIDCLPLAWVMYICKHDEFIAAACPETEIGGANNPLNLINSVSRDY